MLGSIRGTVIRTDGLCVLIENKAGVGYEVEMPLSCLNNLRPGDEVFAYLHEVIREDADMLYGFLDLHDRTLFRQILKVTGIGPKIGLAILSSMSTEAFISAVRGEQTTKLTAVPGIGKKTAERIIMEMKDKLKMFAFSEGGAASSEGGSESSTAQSAAAVSGLFASDEAVGALVSLGYKESQAVEYVNAVIKEGMDTSEIIVAALAYLSGGAGKGRGRR